MPKQEQEVYRFEVSPKDAGRLIKGILQGELKMSRRLLRQLAQQANAVRVNGKAVYLTSRVAAGDVVEVWLPAEELHIEAAAMPLDIRYEDDEVVVVNKPAGVLTHPTAHERTGTLLGGVAAYLSPVGLIPHSVHRLDRDTSGLILFAKHAHAHHLFDLAMRKGWMHRAYCALVQVVEPSGLEIGRWKRIDFPIAQDERKPSRRIISLDGQPATTHYRMLAMHGETALVQVVLETGRTHQIRLHFAASGIPLIGDTHYNVWANQGVGSPMARQALHAVQLGFRHPVSDETRVVSAIVPDDMREYWLSVGGKATDLTQLTEDFSALRIVKIV